MSKEIFKMNSPVNRLRGNMPKIGIRPVSDGKRKGMSESLENQTIQIEKTAAKFLSNNLKHPNGLPVE